MHRYPDLRDRYPEVERPLRLDGRPNSVEKCLEPVIKNIERIVNVIEDIAVQKELEYAKTYVFQSRAMGTCKPTSDIDLYVQLNEKHREIVKTNGEEYAGTGIVILSGAWAQKFLGDLPKHLHEELKELHIDIFWGVEEIPPAKDQYIGRKYYLELKDLQPVTEKRE